MGEPRPRQVSSFSQSLSRCLANPAFLDRFYELFISSSETIAEKFRDTDFERQKRALSSSLYAMVMAAEGGEAAIGYLDQIARRHGRQDLDIPPEMYDVWLTCLIQAVRESDPDFTLEVEQVWRGMMRFGIQFMRDRY